ncbi:MAG TPA: GspH/FimT family pseudopilin [Casimicrobiaceae bacterium]
MGPLTRARRGAVAGFTLVEILVAVAIVAIVSAAAFLAWRGGDAGTLRRDAERFAGALEYAAQRAQWRHENLGVSVDATGYRFWQRDLERDAWVPLAGDDVLVARDWPDGSTLFATARAGRALPPATLVALRADGRNDPLTIVLAAGDTQWRVDVDPLNRVTVAAVP